MDTAWLVTGLAGQLAFGARFLVQWIVSERRGRSVIPTAFWWLSLLGGLVLLSYAVHRRDPVFILGQGFGLIVYSRNIVLIRRRERRARRFRRLHARPAPTGSGDAPPAADALSGAGSVAGTAGAASVAVAGAAGAAGGGRTGLGHRPAT